MGGGKTPQRDGIIYAAKGRSWEWRYLRAEKTPVIGREEMESSVLKAEEGEDSRNEFSLERKHSSEVKARLQTRLFVLNLPSTSC